MSHHSRQWSQFGLLSALLGVVLLGCQPQNPPPAPAPVAQPNLPIPGPVAPRDDRQDEDPEVLAYYKSKGWDLTTMPIAGNIRLFLQVRSGKNQLDGGMISPEDYKMIARSKAVRGVLFEEVNCTDKGLMTVAGMPALELIRVHGENVTDDGMKALAGCKSLVEVAVVGCPRVTDAGIRELAALPNLRSLYMRHVTLNWSALASFSESRSLRSLVLDSVGGLTDMGITHLGKIPNLDCLIIAGVEPKFTTAGIKAILDERLPDDFRFDNRLIDDELFVSLVAKGWLYGPSLPGSPRIIRKPATAADVREIDLRGANITDVGFKSVLACTNLTELTLDDTGITDETLMKLGGFSKLEQLSLNHTKVTAAGLEAMLESISGYPLRVVKVEGCELTENAFKAFAQMTGLVSLRLSQAKTKGDWLKPIAHLPKLTVLDLSETNFDDAAVKHVTTMSALESLRLDHTKLTDSGFQEVLKLPKLTSLSVTKTKVTKETFQKARKDYPTIHITDFDHD